jgi:hypothetical protein
VRQFYDPNKRSGKAIAKSIGWGGRVAWDIYLFYEEGSEWIEGPPVPTAWIHQLNENWADRAHFRTGADLVEELFKTMKKLLPIQHREP